MQLYDTQPLPEQKDKKPLNEIVKAMEQVKAGEKGVNLEFDAESEFVEIRDTFNMMIEELEESRREKEEMERKKSQLLLELSHDIKTPLATIKGYANAMESNLVPEEKKAVYYQTIDKKADRVCDLTENMFLMLKMENADYHLQLEQLDICELARQICAEFYEDIDGAGFSMEIDIPEQSCLVWADEKALGRVIGNLLSNAGKYNRTGSQVGITLSILEKQVELCVWDDGELIPKELQETIFDAFVRGDKARKTDGGTGLGLAISRAIMEKHCGSIGYEEKQGQNCFVVRMQRCGKIK
jgi:signal transduction histidine kinase